MSKSTSAANSAETVKNVKHFLSKNPVGVLSTVTPELLPHAVVIYFSVQDDLSVCFVTKKDTKKNQNLKKHKSAVLVAYEAGSQTTVQVVGNVSDITYSPEAQEAFKKTLEVSEKTSGSGVPPISKLDAGHYVAYKLQPKEIRMAVFARSKSTDSEIYQTLNF